MRRMCCWRIKMAPMFIWKLSEKMKMASVFIWEFSQKMKIAPMLIWELSHVQRTKSSKIYQTFGLQIILMTLKIIKESTLIVIILIPKIINQIFWMRRKNVGSKALMDVFKWATFREILLPSSGPMMGEVSLET